MATYGNPKKTEKVQIATSLVSLLWCYKLKGSELKTWRADPLAEKGNHPQMALPLLLVIFCNSQICSLMSQVFTKKWVGK